MQAFYTLSNLFLKLLFTTLSIFIIIELKLNLNVSLSVIKHYLSRRNILYLT